MKVVVLGAGPAGLALIDEVITTQHCKFILIEKDNQVGGLAKTLEWKNWGKHDLGPHKIFSLDKDLLNRVENLIPAQNWVTQPKKSRIFLGGHYLPYPPSPFSLINIFGIVIFVKMVLNFLLAKLKVIFVKSEPKTFQEDLEARMGSTLFEYIFKPVAVKLWDDPSKLDVKLSKGRVQTPSIVEVILRLLKLKKTSEFEALDFKYPKGGLQTLWEAIISKNKNNGEVLLTCKVSKIEISADNYIEKITYIDQANGQTHEVKVEKDDFVFSSMPISVLASVVQKNFSSEFKKALGSVQLNDLILVFLKFNTPKLFADSWVFIPDEKVCFHRVSDQASFDPSMTPNGTIVCCEIMSRDGRNFMEQSDQSLVDQCIAGLKTMGLSNVESLLQDSRIVKVPQSYPVYRPGFEPHLELILNQFDSFKNLKTIGRQGAFNYIGTVDAMDIGYGAAKWYISQTKKQTAFNEERKRTSYYPVLD